MTNKLKVVFCLFLAFQTLIQTTAQELFKPPQAKRIQYINVLHNDTTIDYYHWMKDKYDTDFINYLYAENAYADRMMKKSQILRKKLYEEYRSYMQEQRTYEPVKKDNYYYYSRYEKDKEYPIYCRKKDSLTAAEEVYFDLNKLADEYMYVSLMALKISPDHKIMAYALNSVGGDAGYYFFKNLETGKMYPEEIEYVAGFEWCGNSKTFYYQLENQKTKKADRIYRHTLGDSINTDTLIYREHDKKIDLMLGKTGKYLLLTRESFNESEQLYLNEDKPYELFIRFEPLQKNVEYALTHYKQEDCFYIRTNWNAPERRFMRAKIKPTAKKDWEDIILPRKDVTLKGVVVKKDYFIASERKEGNSYYRVINRKTKEEYQIKPDMEVYALGIGRTFDYDTTYFRYYYSSLLTPAKQFTHYLETNSDSVYIDTLAKKPDINPDDYITQRLWAVTKDSVKVPMDIVYKKDLKLDGTAPVYMYAYACYGSVESPGFYLDRKSIVDRGFIYVLAHPRGESLLGKEWHEKGRLLYKKNTYTDIIACTEYLIKEKYTAAGKVSIRGGSAGGMLVGAVVTMRPDLFGVAVANVPFVDVLNQMQDTSWSNIISHFDEIGNPFIKQGYDTLKTWCPYQNTKAVDYPPLLVTSGYNDSRVPVWSPAKWVAKLRYLKTDSNQLLLKTNMDAGHGGSAGRYSYLKDEAFTMAFIMKSLGIEENYIEVKGKVTDLDGTPLPFVNIYLKGTTYGTCSNYDGDFLLELKAGQPAEIIFKSVGFTSKTVKVDINTRTSDLKVVLENEDVYISQVIVTSDGKDPAYGIIKKAQKKRKYYRDLVKAYSADVYMKGSDRLNEVPKKFPKFLKGLEPPDSSDIGLLYLSESVARYHFKQPDDYKEEMFASKQAGRKQGYSWNRASDVLMSFYNNQIDMKWFSERDFISPIASSANFYYKYKLIETYKEDGDIIHKIKVIPRRKSDPIFKGYIYIVDKEWSIQGINLTIGKESQIEMIDSINIKQAFVPVTDSIRMPLSMELTQHIKIFKFGVTVKNLAFFSNYKINRKFPPDFFHNEVFRVEKGANKKDSVFWEDTRPALLTLEEIQNYSKGDSLMRIKESKTYRDSVNHERNKVTFGKIALSGYTYRNHFKNYSWGFNSIVSMVDFNTVDGWTANFEPYLYKRADSLSMSWYAKYYTKARIRYSFTNNKIYAVIAGMYNIEYIKHQRLNFAGGIMSQQYNPYAIDPLLNSLYSLFYVENHAKFYEKTYGKAAYSIDLNPAFRLKAGMEYAHRKALVNNTDYSFVSIKDKEYTSNNPQDPANDAPAFESNNAFVFDAELTFYFRRKYATYPDLRMYYRTKMPIIKLHYKKGLNIFGSDVNYDYLNLSISDIIKLKNFGDSHYKVAVGSFLNSKSMYFMDYRHFSGNQTIFMKAEMDMNSYNTLPYYSFSSNSSFFEAHYEHHFNGWVINKFPLIRKLKFQTLVGMNFLYTEEQKDYTELFFGVENILNFLRVDFVGRYQSNSKFGLEFRLGIDLGI